MEARLSVSLLPSPLVVLRRRFGFDLLAAAHVFGMPVGVLSALEDQTQNITSESLATAAILLLAAPPSRSLWDPMDNPSDDLVSPPESED